MNFQRRGLMEDEEPTINLTPLMDIMFLLVIFLIVTTTFRVYQGFNINLPEAQAGSVRKEEGTLVAVLNRRGEIYLDGRPLGKKDLVQTLRALHAASPAYLFVVEADELAQHGRVVELMDAARQVGIARLAIATREKDKDAAAGLVPAESSR